MLLSDNTSISNVLSTEVTKIWVPSGRSMLSGVIDFCIDCAVSESLYPIVIVALVSGITLKTGDP